MGKILAVARNTFLEAIRDRILYGFLFFAVCLILFSLVLGQLSVNEEARAVIDVGMAGVSFFAVLMAIFLGISLLHKEIEKRTLYTVLSRPISRSAYLVGKFFGLSGTMLVQIALMTLVWILVLKIQGAPLPAGMLVAMILISVETILVISMALFFTSFSSPFLSGLFCLGFFVAGRNTDLIMQLASGKRAGGLSPALEMVGSVIPNFLLFYPSGKMVEGSFATIHGQFISTGYLFSAIGYAGLYSAFFLLLAMVLLHRRDFI
jgi:Cu-processing system permease protein